jgi:aspartate/methionine/tyrosine aminotransferase
VFARRASWDLDPSEWARRLEARRSRGLPVLDLSDTNPTRAGLRAPAEALAAALADLGRDAAALRYEPDPRGDRAAREAIAAYHRSQGAEVEPDQIVLTAGTSEGYAHLFRLLADPGDVVHLPSPGYGLFEHLAALEGLAVERYPLRAPAGGARWRIDVEALARGLGPRSRAALLIHPHNPTGSFVDPADLEALRRLARERRLALLSDEVFADSAHGGKPAPSALAGAEEGPLHFVLSGASKPLALPQLKLAWIAVAGPADARREAALRLEFAADAYLSVSPILARTLPRLFEARGAIRAELLARVAANRARLEAALRGVGAAELLPAEAGWVALVRFEAARGDGPDEEALVLELLDTDGVLVQPGFLFDLEPPREDVPSGYLALGLLAEPGLFARGAEALARRLAESLAP